REQVGHDREEVDDELPDETRQREDVHQPAVPGGGVPAPHEPVTVASSTISIFGARTRNTLRTIRSAARNRITSAWMMSMTSMGTLDRKSTRLNSSHQIIS